MTRLFRALMAAVLLTSLAVTPVGAYSYTGYIFYTSSIDTDSDGAFDLMICFGASGQSVYENRGEIITFVRDNWGRASLGDQDIQGGTQYVNGFGSSGACGTNDPADIQLKMSNKWGACGLNIPYAAAIIPTSNYGKITIEFNSYCPWDYSGTIQDNYASFKSIALHEIGHALGLWHVAPNNALMDDGGPDHCNYHDGLSASIAADDAAGFRARYTGIYDDGAMWPTSTYCYD